MSYLEEQPGRSKEPEKNRLDEFLHREMMTTGVDTIHVGQAYGIECVHRGEVVPEAVQGCIMDFVVSGREEGQRIWEFFKKWHELPKLSRENPIYRNERAQNLCGLIASGSYEFSLTNYLLRINQALADMRKWFPQTQKVVERLSSSGETE